MIDAALGYADRGWPVFPCDPRTKRPLTPAGKDGSGGLKLATTNLETISGWWKRWPKAMIGVPTGEPIGAFVVDIDAGADPKTGEVFEVDALVTALEAQIGVAMPVSWSVVTPRGGRHVYYRLPPRVTVGNRTGLVSRVDVRGTGGYVIAPPSRRADGTAYRWERAPW